MWSCDHRFTLTQKQLEYIYSETLKSWLKKQDDGANWFAGSDGRTPIQPSSQPDSRQQKAEEEEEAEEEEMTQQIWDTILPALGEDGEEQEGGEETNRR